MRLYTAVALLALVTAEAAEFYTLHHQTAAQRIRKILQRVRKNDRDEFTRYHVQKGYEVAQQTTNARYPGFNYEITDEDSVLFYEYFATYNQVKDEEVTKVARTIICWKDKCIDFSDPGVHP